jgi:hypothetical protein
MNVNNSSDFLRTELLAGRSQASFCGCNHVASLPPALTGRGRRIIQDLRPLAESIDLNNLMSDSAWFSSTESQLPITRLSCTISDEVERLMRSALHYCNFAYSALAFCRTGISRSASFHSVRKS